MFNSIQLNVRDSSLVVILFEVSGNRNLPSHGESYDDSNILVGFFIYFGDCLQVKQKQLQKIIEGYFEIVLIKIDFGRCHSSK